MMVIFRYLYAGVKKCFKILVQVREKVTYEMYARQKEKNENIGKKLRENYEKMDEHKDKIYALYEEINVKNRKIKNYEEKIRKQSVKINLLEKENSELKDKITNITQCEM